MHDALVALIRADPVLELERGRGARRAGDGLQDALAVFGVDVGQQRLSECRPSGGVSAEDLVQLIGPRHLGGREIAAPRADPRQTLRFLKLRHHELALAFGLLAPGDVTHNRAKAGHVAGVVSHRRDRDRDLDQGAVLTSPDSLIELDVLAGPRARDHSFEVSARVRLEHRDRLADRLVRPIAEDLLRAAIPDRDHAVEIGADDCGIGRDDDRRERAIDVLNPLAIGDVAADREPTQPLAGGGRPRRRVDLVPTLAAQAEEVERERLAIESTAVVRLPEPEPVRREHLAHESALDRGGVEACLGEPAPGGEDVAEVAVKERHPRAGQALESAQGEL